MENSTACSGGDRPLLQGKITVPAVPGQVLLRPRLFADLTAASSLPVTTVLAPAGWGKTQLLCSWLSFGGPDGPDGWVGWLSLDAADNDPVRFWAYVLAALREACRLPTEHPLSALSPPLGAEPQTLDRFLALLVNALGTLDQNVTLILDDVHELDSPDTLRSLGFLLRHSPPQLRLLLAGRSFLGVPLGRIRVAGQLAEVGSAQLAFTDDEVVEIFSSTHGDIPRDELVGLRERAEGWPAGIRLAQMSLRGAEHPTDLLADFSGDLNLVADYLLSEVLSQLEPDLVDFLLCTSIVERLNDELANVLSERSDGAGLLERMEAANAFVVAQGKRPWYRYHQLFREMLQHTLRRKYPAEVAGLHRSAAGWFAANGQPVDAARHAISGEGWETLKAVMSSAWIQLFLDGELSTLTRLLSGIPEQVVQTDAELSLIRGAVRFSLDDDAARAAGDLARADELVEREGGEVSSSFATARAMVSLERARLAGDVVRARDAAAELLVPDDGGTGARPEVRALAQLNLGVTEYFNGDRRAAERCLREGLALSRSSGRDYLALGCLSQLTIVLTAQNRLKEALRVAQQAIVLAEQRGWSETLQMAVGTWHAMGWIHYMRADPETAELYLDRAEEAVRSRDAAAYGSIHVVQALVSNLRNDKMRALNMLDAAVNDLEPVMSSYVFTPYIVGERVRILISIGQHERARRELDALGPSADESIHLLVARAELQIADGDLAGSLTTLIPAASGEAQGFLDQMLQAQVLCALVLDRLGQHQEAARWLAQAVSLAEPEGFKQPFLQFGEPARAMLARYAVDRKESRRYSSELITAFTSIGVERSPSVAGQETLTDREIEVLRCLSDMMTTPEIAAQLFVSVNTIKAHLKHIYSKLDVASRRQAVARGRTLGLID